MFSMLLRESWPSLSFNVRSWLFPARWLDWLRPERLYGFLVGARRASEALEGELSSIQRMSVGIAATYYTVMLLIWTAPAVLQAKVRRRQQSLFSNSRIERAMLQVAAEEVYDASSLLAAQLLSSLLFLVPQVFSRFWVHFDL